MVGSGGHDASVGLDGKGLFHHALQRALAGCKGSNLLEVGAAGCETHVESHVVILLSGNSVLSLCKSPINQEARVFEITHLGEKRSCLIHVAQRRP